MFQDFQKIEPYFSKVWLPSKGGDILKKKLLEICSKENIYANKIMNFDEIVFS